MRELIWALILRAAIPGADVVYKQALLESAGFTSRLCLQQYNLFGLKKGEHYASFCDYSECVNYYATHVSVRYRGGSYYHFLHRIGYAADRRYIAKLHKINTLNMRYAVVLDSTNMGCVAYLADTREVAPIKSIDIKLCCGNPISVGSSITPDGRLHQTERCCGQFQHLTLKAGDRITGELVHGTFEADSYVGPAGNQHLPITGSINTAE